MDEIEKDPKNDKKNFVGDIKWSSLFEEIISTRFVNVC
jgi:hypothetical protein